MNIATGDIWDVPAQAKCFTSNGVLTPKGEAVMGAGIAKQVKDMWPTLPSALGYRISEHGNRVYVFRLDQFTQRFNCWYLIAFPTKRHYADPSDRDLIMHSLFQLVDISDSLGLEDVILPKPGCGLGGLSWDSVRPLCEANLDDRFTIMDKV